MTAPREEQARPRYVYTCVPARYQGHTYPRIFDNALSQWLCKRLCCPRGWHLWDEVASSTGHKLICDACDTVFGWSDDADFLITDYHDSETGALRPESEWPA